nr:voltage-dependent calcium channel gamma-1 subunit [Vicugna pacos]
MSQTKALKVRVTLFCILVGIALALVAVVTDHWAVLSPHVEHLNATCEAAHFGLWRICTKRIFVGHSKDKSCGPITLPGEKNCSYFRHFNPGESSEIFEVTTQKGEPVVESREGEEKWLPSHAAEPENHLAQKPQPDAVKASGGVGGVGGGGGKGRGGLQHGVQGPKSPALPSGLCIFVSVEVMRQSVKRMIDSEDTVWIEYSYSWSFACACAAFVLLFLGGLALLLFSLPRMPQNPWESCMDAEPEH